MPCPTLTDLPPPPAGRTGWPWTEESPRAPAAMPDGSPWPRVSIVTPSYNQGRFLEETIRSVLLQGYPNLEYFIIDGGSTDESVAIIRKYEPWLTYWVSEPDRGQSDAINKGFERATGDVVAWINSDDWYACGVLPDRVVYLVEHPEAALVYGDLHYVDESGVLEGVSEAKARTARDLLLFEGGIPQPTVFMRAEALRQVGGLDTRWHYIMDWDLWLRLGLVGDYVPLPGHVANFRKHDTSKTVSVGHKFMLEHLAWWQERPQPQTALTPEERAEALRRLHLRTAVEYMLARDEGKAARHLSEAFADGVWPWGGFEGAVAYLEGAGGLNGQALLSAPADCALLRRCLRAALPARMARCLWRYIMSDYYMGQVFRDGAQGRDRVRRDSLARGLWYGPHWLLNLGVWSIALDALLGRRVTDVFRKAARAVCPK